MDTLNHVLSESGCSHDDMDEIVLVGGSTRIPALRRLLTDIFKKELCTSIDADLAVAQGAAIQAAILSGVDHQILKDILMLDVLPRSIGIEKEAGAMEVLLPKNTKLPARATKYFSTAQDDQAGLTIRIYEGEDARVQNNILLGEFDVFLPRSKRSKAGVWKHPVTLEMDSNGLLHLQAGIHREDEEETPFSRTILLSVLVALIAMYFGLAWTFSSERFNH